MSRATACAPTQFRTRSSPTTLPPARVHGVGETDVVAAVVVAARASSYSTTPCARLFCCRSARIMSLERLHRLPKPFDGGRRIGAHNLLPHHPRTFRVARRG